MKRSNTRARAARALTRPRTAALLGILLWTSALTSGQTPIDTIDPMVRVTAPVEDATVSGTVTITAEASDAGGVAGVIFEVDGIAIGPEDTTAPWSITWDAHASGIGSHVLTAIARDVAGNADRSDIVPVVVGAAAPPTFPPPPPANRNPVAAADELTSAGRVPVPFTGASLLANDSDPDSNPLHVTLVAASSTGGGTVVSHGADAYTYTPAAAFTGADSFLYSISDGNGGTSSSTVTVTVTAPAPPAAPAGLVLALRFDESTGPVAADSSANGLNGSVSGAQFVPGRTGNALSFDGVNDWVTIADTTGSPLDLTSGLTLQAWVKPSSLSGWDTVLMKERGTAGMSYALYAHDGGPLAGGANTPAGYVTTAAGDRSVRPAAALPLNVWSHVATTYDGANQRFYVNGALVATRAQTGAVAVGNGALRIGGNAAWSGEFFQGVIDEVRVYNRALTQAEIAADMSGGVALPPAPVVNRVPVAADDSATTTGTAAVTLNVLANDSDPDGDVLSVASAAATAGGTAVRNADNTVTFTAVAGFTGIGRFTYTVNDGRGGLASATGLVTVNAPAPVVTLPAGLVAAFNFDLAGGTSATTAINAAGSGDGAIAGAVLVSGRPGSGQALSFDGGNDLVTVADGAALDLTAAMTLSAWVNPSTLSGGSGWKTIVLKERGASGLSYGLYANDGPGVSQPAAYIAVGGSDRRVGAQPALAVNTWTHLAVTYDGSTMRLYVNGVLRSSVAQAGAITASANPLRIGGNTVFGQEFFAGLLDDVRVYNRALSAQEVVADRDVRVP